VIEAVDSGVGHGDGILPPGVVRSSVR
jgi:hypothetical protein